MAMVLLLKYVAKGVASLELVEMKERLLVKQ